MLIDGSTECFAGTGLGAPPQLAGCEKKKEGGCSGWKPEHSSWRSPGSVASADRAPPPGCAAASSTVTSMPLRARVRAAESPFGPLPTTIADVTAGRHSQLDPRASAAPDRAGWNSHGGVVGARALSGVAAPEVDDDECDDPCCVLRGVGTLGHGRTFRSRGAVHACRDHMPEPGDTCNFRHGQITPGLCGQHRRESEQRANSTGRMSKVVSGGALVLSLWIEQRSIATSARMSIERARL